jgi:hypothetical protein
MRRGLPMPYRGRSRNIPMSTARSARSSSQSISSFGVPCWLPEPRRNRQLAVREELSHGGSPREREHHCEAREGGNRFPP